MQNVNVEHEGLVAVVSIQRPKVNALDAATFRELTQVFKTLGRTRDSSAVILTAPGDRIFCAGVDLADSQRRHARVLNDADTTVDLLDPGALPRECFDAVMDCPLPVIAAVNGMAIGAGLAIVACCDIVIASENATFSVPEIKAGVLGGSRHLQRLVGPQKTRRMFFTGESIDAHEMYRLGAVEQVTSPAELMPVAMRLAQQIASMSPIGLRLAKESMNRSEHLSVQEGYRIEQDYTGRVTRYEDSGEARAARMEKRDPQWQWR